MRTTKIILIVLLILILMFFGGRYLIMYLMQDGLAKGWIDKIEGNPSAGSRLKITVPEGVKASIKNNLAKLGYQDLNTLVTFSNLMKNQDYVGALTMRNEVWPILSQKTDLAQIKELQGIIIR